MTDDFKDRPWPWNKFRSQFMASAARTDYKPLPPVQDAPIPTLTGFYDEGRCPQCHRREAHKPWERICNLCLVQDRIDHPPTRHYVTKEDLR